MKILKTLQRERDGLITAVEEHSFQTVIMGLIGGATTVAGPVLGAVFLGLASEILLVKLRYYYMLGLTLIIIVLLMPARLVGLARRPTPRR